MLIVKPLELDNLPNSPYKTINSNPTPLKFINMPLADEYLLNKPQKTLISHMKALIIYETPLATLKTYKQAFRA